MRPALLFVMAALISTADLCSNDVTLTHTYHPDGSVASTREVEALTDGGTIVTRRVYPAAGEACTVCHIDAQGHVLWAINRIGEKFTYGRDERQRIIQVTYAEQRYLIEYDANGVISGIRFPDAHVRADQFRKIYWKGLQLLGERQTTGDVQVLIADPLILQDEI